MVHILKWKKVRNFLKFLQEHRAYRDTSTTLDPGACVQLLILHLKLIPQTLTPDLVNCELRVVSCELNFETASYELNLKLRDANYPFENATCQLKFAS